MFKQSIAVTGSSGFLGHALVAELSRQDFLVHAISRNSAPASTPNIQHFHVSRYDDEKDLTPALNGVKTLVHCAARAHVLNETKDDILEAYRQANTAPTLHLAKMAAEAGVRRFIFISSIGVNGNETWGQAFTANTPPNPHSPYATSKFEAERGLFQLSKQTGLEIVVIRPPLITGPNPKGNLGTLKKIIDKGIPLPFSLATKNRRDLVSLGTLISLITTCIDHPNAPGEVFLVSDGKAVSTRDIIEDVAHRADLKMRLFPFPLSLLSMGLKASGRHNMASQLFGDLEIDISDTKHKLGWKPKD